MSQRIAARVHWAVRTLLFAWLSCTLVFAAQAAPEPQALPDNHALGDVAPPAPIAETITADTSGGYARILFTYRTPTQVTASIENNVLVVRMARPIDTDVVALVGRLASYITSARHDADRKTYRFGLGVPVKLHTTTSGGRTAIDLVPQSFAGVPPDLPPPPAPTRSTIDVAKLPVTRVRVAEYSNFTRIVFEWPSRVAYSAFPGKGRVTVRFETLARPDFSMLVARAPAWVKNAGWRIEDKALLVDIDTDPESTFHNSRDGNKVMIDVLAPRTDAEAYAAASSHALPDIVASAPAAPETVPPQTNGASAPPAAIVPQTPPEQAQVAAAPATPGPPTANLQGDGAELRFPDAHGHAVAVFVRGETTWIVLDNHPPLEAATLFANIAPIVEKADADQSGSAAVLRLKFKTPLVATVSDDNGALIVTFAATGEPPRAVSISRGGANGRATLTTQLVGAVSAIRLTDPDAGDRLWVIPARPGRGLLTPRRFVELEALPSTSGLAVVPFADDITVTVRSDFIEFGRPSGLLLSTASGTAPEPVVQTQRSGLGPAYIDFVHWRGAGDDLYATERKLIAATARLAESDANKARLVLARFLIAHELAPEALGVINLMQASDPKLASDPSLAALRGAADYMMGRYADARTALSTTALDNDPHAALWRGLTEAKLERWSEARRDLAAADAVLHFYPPEWTVRARVARATTGIATGDIATAADAMEGMGTVPAGDEAQAHLLAARILAARGYRNQAIAAMRVVEASRNPPVAADATFVRVETELAAGRIKPAQAIDQLEQLRYRWRGDNLELRTLRKLGGLYFDAKRWREGLSVLRVAALNFGNTDSGREAQDQMRTAFTDLFLHGKADAMKPVDSLSLFYDFIELTPIGADGDEMIRRLSDRLVAVDLLGPAEQLLDHQVHKRLDGVARAVVATKLAAIYLLDHKPKDALGVINDTRQTRLPDEINEQRRLLESRALAAMKQYDMAIDLIADDDTPDAKRLRADVYWEASNWPVAAAKIEELLGDRWQSDAALTEQERNNVMRAAISYSLAGDDVSLVRFKLHYAPKMNASADASAFAVVTEKIDRQGVAFRDLARKVASVDTLERFMTDFRKHMGETAAPPTHVASN